MPVPRRPSRLKSFFSFFVPSRVKHWWIRRAQRKSLGWAQQHREPELLHQEIRDAAHNSLHQAVSAEEAERQKRLLQEQLRKHVMRKEEESNIEEGRDAGEERNTEKERNAGEE